LCASVSLLSNRKWKAEKGRYYWVMFFLSKSAERQPISARPSNMDVDMSCVV